MKRSDIGRVLDISRSGLSVTLPAHVEPGARVQIEMADSVLIGSVVYSNQEQAYFRTGIEVDQVNLGTTSLAGILERTLLAEMPDTPGLESVNSYLS